MSESYLSAAALFSRLSERRLELFRMMQRKAGAALLALCPLASAHGAAEQAAGPVVKLASPVEIVAFERGAIGFNMNIIPVRSSPGDFGSPAMLDMVGRVPLQAARYPGGTIANFFDWKRHQYDVSAVKKHGQKKLLGSLKWQRKINGGDLIAGNFDSFMALTIEQNLRRFVVLNLYTRDAQRNFDVMKDIKAKYPMKFYWELGNELSHSGYQRRYKGPGPWSPAVYSERAKAIVEQARKAFPQDRFGVPVEELLDQRRILPLADKHRKLTGKWDEQIRQESFYDAVIVHPYVLYFGEKRWQKHFKTERADYVPSDAAQRTIRWIFANAQELPGHYVETLAEKFPGKRVWITEMGLITRKKADIDPKLEKSIVRSLFLTTYLINWLRYYPDVEVYLYHLLNSGRGTSSAFYPDGSLNANSIAYAFVKLAFEDAVGIGRIDVDNAPTFPGSGRYADTAVRTVNAVYVRSSKQDRILLTNTGRDSVRVSLPFDRATVTVWSSSPADTIEPGKIRSIDQIVDVQQVDDHWKLPPYSIAVIAQR